MKPWTGLTAFLMAGCTLTPDYQQPDVPVAQYWRDHQQAASTEPLLNWDQVFVDPHLHHLIAQALQHNRNLQVAVLRIEEARRHHHIQSAKQAPSVELSGSTQRKQVSALDTQSGERSIREQAQFGVGITAFELDLWGRVAALKEAAGHDFVATQEDAHSVQISLVAEVASQYYKAVALLQLRDQHHEMLRIAQTTQQLMAKRQESGLISELRERQAENRVLSLQAELAETFRQLSITLNSLEYLVGIPLQASRLQLAVWGNTSVLAAVNPGIPSQLLTRRPDIRAAERRLKALDANIGAARAAFLPTISLTALLGVSSPQLDQLFSADARSWSFSPQLTLPLFDMGKRLAQLDFAQAKRDIAVAQYQQTIQQAFREVADALGSAAPLNTRLEALQRLVANERRRAELADLLYQEGLSSYLEVLEAQRDLNSARQDLIEVRLLQINNQISLYKSLGGGWVPS